MYESFLVLFKIATLSAVGDTARIFMAVRSDTQAPLAYAHPEMAIFFYAFVIIGSFFAMNLFCGVIINNFLALRAEYDGSALQTVEQQQWCVLRDFQWPIAAQRLTPRRFVVVIAWRTEEYKCSAWEVRHQSREWMPVTHTVVLAPRSLWRSRSNMQRVLQAIRPKLYIEEPKNLLRRYVFRIVMHPTVDNAITGCIIFNTIVMALEHDGQSAVYVSQLRPVAAVVAVVALVAALSSFFSIFSTSST